MGIYKQVLVSRRQRWARYFFQLPEVPVLGTLLKSCFVKSTGGTDTRYLKINSAAVLSKKSSKQKVLPYILLIFNLPSSGGIGIFVTFAVLNSNSFLL